MKMPAPRAACPANEDRRMQFKLMLFCGMTLYFFTNAADAQRLSFSCAMAFEDPQGIVPQEAQAAKNEFSVVFDVTEELDPYGHYIARHVYSSGIIGELCFRDMNNFPDATERPRPRGSLGEHVFTISCSGEDFFLRKQGMPLIETHYFSAQINRYTLDLDGRFQIYGGFWGNRRYDPVLVNGECQLIDRAF
jgi:hypothetical protein